MNIQIEFVNINKIHAEFSLEYNFGVTGYSYITTYFSRN